VGGVDPFTRTSLREENNEEMTRHCRYPSFNVPNPASGWHDG
jgi:hypothetical protein